MRINATYYILNICLSVFVMAGRVQAQVKPPLEYQLKAAFLFNFTRFVHWPATTYATADAPFIIGIAGNDLYGTYIDDLVKDEQADGHQIIVKRYADGQDITGCQLLFINQADLAKLKSLLVQCVHQNILTVGDTEDFIRVGGILRFYKDDNKIKIEIRLAAAKAAQLEISSKLLQVAKVK